MFFFLKLGISIVILYFIFRKIDLNQVWLSVGKIDFGVFFLIFLLTALKILIDFFNWQSFLSVNPQYASRKSEIIKSLFIGYSLRFLIPGGYGIVGKMYFVNNKKSATFVSLAIEKFFQIWLLLVTAAFSAIFYFRNVSLIPKLIFFAFVLSSPYIFYHLRFVVRKNDFSLYFQEYQKIIPLTMLRKIIYMILTIFQFFVIFRQFVAIPFFRVAISVPLVLFSNIIPITYSGLGLRETFAMEIFPKFGISAEIAVTATLTIFLFTSFLPAIIGLYFIVSHKKSG